MHAHVKTGAAAPVSSDPARRALVGSVWLPIGSTNFSHFFRERDPDSQQEPEANQVSELSEPSGTAPLDTSVLRRLDETLYRSGYRLCVPLSSEDDREHAGSVVFLAPRPTTRQGVRLHNLRNMVLVVTEDGFLTWIMCTDDSGALDLSNEFLEHVVDLFGDISHEEDRTAGSRNIDLRSYARAGGILNYFQLNIILEGLWNRNFQLDYFFSDRRSEDDLDLNRDVRSKYSIPEFIEPLLVEHEARDRVAHLAREAVDALLAGRRDPTACVKACRALSDRLTSQDKRTHRSAVLLRFLRVTKDRSLLQTKIRIEICRRALVQELLGVAHRVQPVEQIVSPDMESETLDSVSESQLRGYLMLVAAKLPIAQNLSLYLSEAVQQCADEGDLLDREYVAWKTLLESVADNVQSLERAVAQSSRDRALYEQEQVRAENETLAEIERLRDSDPGDSVPGLEDSSFGALEVAIALGVSFSAATKYIHGWNWLFLSPVYVLGLILIFGLMHKVASWVLHAIRIRRWSRAPMSSRVFYELDLRVDGYITNRWAEALVDGDGLVPDWTQWLRAEPRSQVEAAFELPDLVRRSSFRIERVTGDESISKVHMDVMLRLTHQYRFRRMYERLHIDKERMHVSVTYELVFHRSGQRPGYILREFRARATHHRPLLTAELEALRTLVIQGVVNPLLEGKDKLSEGDSKTPADSVFALRPSVSGSGGVGPSAPPAVGTDGGGSSTGDGGGDTSGNGNGSRPPEPPSTAQSTSTTNGMP